MFQSNGAMIRIFSREIFLVKQILNQLKEADLQNLKILSFVIISLPSKKETFLDERNKGFLQDLRMLGDCQRGKRSGMCFNSSCKAEKQE